MAVRTGGIWISILCGGLAVATIGCANGSSSSLPRNGPASPEALLEKMYQSLREEQKGQFLDLHFCPEGYEKIPNAIYESYHAFREFRQEVMASLGTEAWQKYKAERLGLYLGTPFGNPDWLKETKITYVNRDKTVAKVTFRIGQGLTLIKRDGGWHVDATAAYPSVKAARAQAAWLTAAAESFREVTQEIRDSDVSSLERLQERMQEEVKKVMPLMFKAAALREKER